jgi:NTE family protein
MFNDDPPRRELPMRRKRAEREAGLGGVIGIGPGGVRLPPSLVRGAKLDNALRANTTRARAVTDFDSLPTPFRAVAADAEDGSMVVLGAGDLSDAIRASMAVPGAFAPQPVGERLLVDGGLVRNVPVDVVRRLGVDVLLVSDVSTPLAEAPEADDVLGLAQRLLTTITVGSSREQIESLGPEDVHILVDLDGITSSDFGALEGAMAAGEAAARRLADRLERLSADDASYRRWVERRTAALTEVEEVAVDRVRVDTSATSLAPGVVTALLDLEGLERVDIADLRERLVRVMGYGGFESATLRVLEEDGGEPAVEIRPQDRRWGPLFLRAGLSLLDRQHGAGGWGLRARVSWPRATRLGGELWGEVEMGTRHGLQAGAHLPLTASERWFVEGTGRLSGRDIFPIGLFPVPLEAVLVDQELSGGVGARLGWWGEAVFGGTIGRSTLELSEELDGEILGAPFQERSLHARVERDGMDRVHFPTAGHRIRLEYRRGFDVLGGTAPFHLLRLDAEVAVSRGAHTIHAKLLTSSGLGSEVPPVRSPALGGIHQLSGAPREAVWGAYGGMARAGWTVRPGGAADGGSLRFGATVEGGNAWFDPAEVRVTARSLRWGGSLWVGEGTLLGPVVAALTFLEGRRLGWSIQVGYPY